MATLKELRLKARLSVNALAKLADVDNMTVSRAENGLPVQDVKAYAILEALGQHIGRRLTFNDIEGLKIL